MRRIRRLSYLLTFVITGAFPGLALAQSALSAPDEAADTSRYSLGFRGENYLGDAVSQQGKRDSLSSLRGSARIYETNGELDGGLWMSALQGINNSSVRYLDVREAYFGQDAQKNPDLNLHLGRKLERWSEVDEVWQLGIWQPRFRWDFLDTHADGLIGLFGSARFSDFQVTAFASPIYLPEQTPPVRFEGGECRSETAFFACPSPRQDFLGQDLRMRYHLQTPQLSDILLNPSGALSIRVGKTGRTAGLWGRVGFAQKPMNQVLVGLDGFMDLNSPTFDVPVTIHPRVVYHQVGSADLGYQMGRVRSWLSVIGEHPIRDQTPSEWTTQEVSGALVVSPGVQVEVWGERASATRVSLGYLHLFDGFAGDTGPLASPNGSLFESRYPYRSAVMYGVQSPIGRYVRTQARLIHDLNINGMFLSSEVSVHPSARWTVRLGADVLGVGSDEGATSLSKGPDFISRQRANDRVQGGLTYVF